MQPWCQELSKLQQNCGKLEGIHPIQLMQSNSFLQMIAIPNITRSDPLSKEIKIMNHYEEKNTTCSLNIEKLVSIRY
jgi:hypothetical protein